MALPIQANMPHSVAYPDLRVIVNPTVAEGVSLFGTRRHLPSLLGETPAAPRCPGKRQRYRKVTRIQCREESNGRGCPFVQPANCPLARCARTLFFVW